MMKKTILLVLVLALGVVTEVANADITFGTPTNLGPTVNSADSEPAASISADGLSIFFTSYNRPGGSGSDDLWVTTRSTIHDPWSAPVNLGPTVNSSSPDGYPSISADGLTLYFSAYNRSGGRGLDDIWMTTRTTTDSDWGTPVNLGPPVDSSNREFSQGISADNLTLYFGTNRSGGSDDYDLWVTTRVTSNDDWSTPVNLGSIVNSSSYDCLPNISADGNTLFFESKRLGGLGNTDLWMTRRKTAEDDWVTPVNLGAAINSSVFEGSPSISADNLTLYFCSNRLGGSGSHDLWQVSIEPVVDFNGDAIVDSADMCIMVDNWGTDTSLCDIGPTPLGDGIVDVQDLIVLAEHLFEEILPIGCVAYWKLDQTEGNIAHNSAGYNDGTCHGEPLWQPTDGHIGGALQFDGIDDYIETDYVLSPADGAFSAFAWIRGGAPGQVIISQADTLAGRTIKPGNTWLGADLSDGRLMTDLGPVSTGSPTPPMISDSVITDGEWHHVGIVVTAYQAMRFRNLYMDGVRVVTEVVPVELPPSNGGLHIGASNNLEAGTFFSGLIDDVRIYNQALSAEEIEALAD